MMNNKKDLNIAYRWEISSFSKFIEDNKGILATIGVFAALIRYFLLSPSTNEINRFILEDKYLLIFTFLLFIFLSATLILKILSKRKNLANGFIFIFGFLFLLFTFVVIRYFVILFKDGFKVIGVLVLFTLIILIGAKLLYSNFILKNESFLFNLLSLIIGAIILWILVLLRHFIVSDYLIIGLFLPLLVLSIIFLFVTIVKMYRCIKKALLKFVNYTTNKPKR